MKILITGGTGLLGRALCKTLLRDGHQLTVLSRKPESVATLCGKSVQAIATLDDWEPIEYFDAVINLAGEPIADASWTKKRKQALQDSRIALTEKLVQGIAVAERKPAVLLSGSAVGYYGNRNNDELDERAGAGGDFPSLLCQEWENAALMAGVHGVRVCLLRTGLVLSPQGGLLGRLLLPFKFALGAQLGNGRQWMSWVHIDDYVAMVIRLLHDAQLSGAFNMTSPYPVTNIEFTRQLAHAVGRPAIFVAPGVLLKWLLGERSILLLEGQRVLPKRMQAVGFKFIHSDLSGALDAIVASTPQS